MSSPGNIEHVAIVGTVSGTALTVFANIGSSDILKTVILATIGAIVSFGMSVLLKWLSKRLK